MKRVVIVGAGISGLAIAHALAQRSSRARGGLGCEIDVRVLEASSRVGGNLRTETAEGFTCEWGPNGFLDSVPETLELVRAVAITDRLQVSDDASRQRFIYRHGRLRELPAGPIGFIRSDLMSCRGKASIALEPFAPSRPEGDETIHAFAARRLGHEAADVLIDTMVSGIFAGDARRLSLRACFPKMWQMETDHGGLFRAMLALRRRKRRGDAMGAPGGRLTSFRGGTEELARGIARSLGDAVITDARVRALRKSRADAAGRLPKDGASGIERARAAGTTGSADEREGASRFVLDVAGLGTVEADAVVLAGAASESAGIVQETDPTLAALLREIPSAPLAVVGLGYEEAVLPRRLDGFGFLVPRGEGPSVLGVLWDSSIFPGRAPLGRVLVRAMIGGAHDPGAASLPDDVLLATVREDLRTTMGLDGPPVYVRIFRHRLGIPQYTVGHLDRLARIEERLVDHPGVFLGGSSYHGVSMNSCVAEAGPTAERLLGFLEADSSVP